MVPLSPQWILRQAFELSYNRATKPKSACQLLERTKRCGDRDPNELDESADISIKC